MVVVSVVDGEEEVEEAEEAEEVEEVEDVEEVEEGALTFCVPTCAKGQLSPRLHFPFLNAKHFFFFVDAFTSTQLPSPVWEKRHCSPWVQVPCFHRKQTPLSLPRPSR